MLRYLQQDYWISLIYELITQIHRKRNMKRFNNLFLLKWLLTLIVFLSSAISVIVGWRANNSFERFRDITFALVFTVTMFFFVILANKLFKLIFNQFFLTKRKISLLIQHSISKGLLPENYKSDPSHDLKIARMILHDRKIGLREKDIKHDLMLYLHKNSHDK